MQTLQQIVDERISFLKEQINPHNKPKENRTFQLQIDAIGLLQLPPQSKMGISKKLRP